MTDNKALIDNIVARIGEVILGKEQPVRLALACLLARGHLLIEDLPGLGKTTLAHTLAAVLGLGFQRIQFTSDMLPADIIGVSIFARDTSTFNFHPGPIFTPLVLADEVNRATPKAQSALLEAMAERQITVDGVTHPLPEPFFVIATQNPLHLIGTFPLPESQLDRFLLRIEMGYPDSQAERALLAGEKRQEMLKRLQPVIDLDTLKELQQQVDAVHASDALLDYLQGLIHFTRTAALYQNGLSPRAGLALLSASRAWALMAGRSHVLPEDIQIVLPGVVGHRLQLRDSQGTDAGVDPVAHLLESVALPA
jgi:MoxR-like ATPase